MGTTAIRESMHCHYDDFFKKNETERVASKLQYVTVHSCVWQECNQRQLFATLNTIVMHFRCEREYCHSNTGLMTGRLLCSGWKQLSAKQIVQPVTNKQTHTDIYIHKYIYISAVQIDPKSSHWMRHYYTPSSYKLHKALFVSEHTRHKRISTNLKTFSVTACETDQGHPKEWAAVNLEVSSNVGFGNERVLALCKVITLCYALKAVLYAIASVTAERWRSISRGKTFDSLLHVDIRAHFSVNDNYACSLFSALVAVNPFNSLHIFKAGF